MKFIITENKIEKLKQQIQTFVDFGLTSLRQESEDWGLGEMDELFEVESIEKIEVVKLDPGDKLNVFINIFQFNDRDEYDNTLAWIEGVVEEVIPNVNFHINKIIKEIPSK